MFRAKIEAFLTQAWYTPSRSVAHILILAPLLVFTPLVHLVTRLNYRHRRVQSPTEGMAPVVVVGNLTVGGTGKTPVIEHIARTLRNRGFRVGIIARGYRGAAEKSVSPYQVDQHSTPSEVGDEPAMLWHALNGEAAPSNSNSIAEIPIVVCSVRQAAIAFMERNCNADVILSDDGLQHYAMGRSYEIVVVDGERQFGNRLLLPAGPLREPLDRMKDVHQVLINGDFNRGLNEMLAEYKQKPEYFSVSTVQLRPLNQAAETMLSASESPECDSTSAITCLRQLAAHSRGKRWCLMAGTGNPQRFFSEFALLANLAGCSELENRTQRFSNHHPYTLESLESLKIDEDESLMMTEKDAVKCMRLLKTLEFPAFALRVQANFERSDWLDTMLRELRLG